MQIGEFFLDDGLRIAVCEDPPVITWDIDDLEVAHAVPTDGNIARNHGEFGGSEEYDCAIEHVIGSVGDNRIPDCGPDFLVGGRGPLRRPKVADAPRQRSKSTLREVSEFPCDEQASMPSQNPKISGHWSIKQHQRSDLVPKPLQFVRNFNGDDRTITLPRQGNRGRSLVPR